MRCIDCKKELHEFHSTWDRFRLFLFHFFHEDIQDVKEEQFTKGYGQGYEAGFEAAKKAQREVIKKYNITL